LESIDDELQRVRVNALDALLDHVITVLVFDAFQDVAVQLAYDFHLLFSAYALQRLLDNPAAVHLQRQRQYVSAHLYLTRKVQVEQVYIYKRAEWASRGGILLERSNIQTTIRIWC